MYRPNILFQLRLWVVGLAARIWSTHTDFQRFSVEKFLDLCADSRHGSNAMHYVQLAEMSIASAARALFGLGPQHRLDV